jgi:hypothetical protein
VILSMRLRPHPESKPPSYHGSRESRRYRQRQKLLGQALSFSPLEKERAHGIVVQNAGTITIGNIGSVSDRSIVAAGHSPQVSGPIDAAELLKLLTEINTHAPQIIGSSEKESAELSAAVNELNDAAEGVPVIGKLRGPLHRVLKVVGSASQTVIAIGLKLYIEQWMKLHGLAP